MQYTTKPGYFSGVQSYLQGKYFSWIQSQEKPTTVLTAEQDEHHLMSLHCLELLLLCLFRGTCEAAAICARQADVGINRCKVSNKHSLCSAGFWDLPSCSCLLVTFSCLSLNPGFYRQHRPRRTIPGRMGATDNPTPL